jgi:hypothetical protein
MNTDASLFARGVRPKIATALDLLGEYGPFRFAFRLLPWLLRRRYVAFTHPLDLIPAPSNGPEGLIVSLAGPADADALARFRPGFYPPGLVERRLREGHLCFLAEEDGRIVHVRWLFIGPVFLPYIRRTLVTAPGEVCSNEAFTAAGHRKRGIHSRAGILIRLRLREMGFRRYTNFVASWNKAPLRTMARLGVPPAGECWTAGFPGRRRFFRSGGVREVGEDRLAVFPPDAGPSSRT